MADKELLFQKIGYEFKQKSLIKAALTHRSILGLNNERLEFLGDSLLNCIIAEALYLKFPNLKEGELSRLRASLVKGETLAKIAQEFNLADYLLLGHGESRSGGARRESILADAVEAIIGAIFLDADFYTCQRCVLNWFKQRFETITFDNDLKDPKTRLQELLQSKHIDLPAYEVIHITGQAHAQEFTIRCQIPALQLSAEGTGKSRRKAEQEAATKLLEKLKNG